MLVVHARRGRLVLVAFGALAFVALGLWIRTLPSNEVNEFKRLIAVYRGVPFFALCFVFAIVRLATNRPMLVVDAEGMILGATAFSPGRILWHEVVELRSVTFKNQKSVGVVTDSEVLRRFGMLTRFMAHANIALTGVPFHIPQATLPMSAEELIEKVQRIRLEMTNQGIKVPHSGQRSLLARRS